MTALCESCHLTSSKFQKRHLLSGGQTQTDELVLPLSAITITQAKQTAVLGSPDGDIVDSQPNPSLQLWYRLITALPFFGPSLSPLELWRLLLVSLWIPLHSLELNLKPWSVLLPALKLLDTDLLLVS